MGFIPRWDLFSMKVDHERNYYNCRRFDHLAKYCRDQKIIRKSKRIEIINNNEHLKAEESLEFLD